MANEGTIRIHRSIGGTGAAFRVAFVPYDSDGEGTANMRSFHEVQHVRAFLKLLGVGAELIKDALRQLAAGRSASVPNVSLTDEVVKSAGLLTTENLERTRG
ncbi:MAG TPA: hypothetical protein VG051_01830 [Candidatus Acidoferrum sp.]|jgi:hypothetical protein|nr:hypothetical protein [Candidatus Acidoferrum sp.]